MVIKLGADGYVNAGTIEHDECCSPLCVNQCALICSFISLLPTGPLWDVPKREAIACFSNFVGECIDDCEVPKSGCQSLISYAVFSAKNLFKMINESLWPTLREMSPYTAVTTIDKWIERLGWEDCYRTLCRTPIGTELTPYEIPGPCGPIYCPIPIPIDLQLALDRAIIIALSRAQIGVRYNLAGINWIIQSLGAEIVPVDTGEDCNPSFNIRPISDTLPAVNMDLSMHCRTVDGGTVQAYIDRGCDLPAGAPAVVWPGIIAAECIVRSMLLPKYPNNIFRTC